MPRSLSLSSCPPPPSTSTFHLLGRAFKAMCDDLEVSLRDCATKVVEEPFEQASRPANNFRLGNHPAFRGAGGGEQDDYHYDEAAAMADEEAAAAARREQEALVVKVIF